MHSRTRRPLAALFVIALFLGGLFVIAPAQANPLVPYCSGSVAPSPGAPSVIMPEVCEAATGRVFPEAMARPEYAQADDAGHMNTGYVSDFVSFLEFEAGLEYLEAQYPQYITVHEVARSVGLCPEPAPSVPLIGDGGDCPTDRDQFPIYMVEITNEESPIPLEERQSLLFMLSIHGNEKGGREGGFRVLEDLVKGISLGVETVQDGAGLPEPIARPAGDGDVQTYQDYLDFQRVFLLFPNADGWAHDELPYPATDPYCGTLFCRTNGNNQDLNRQAPTLGWQNPGRNVVGEPEAIGYYNWMLTNNITWSYAIDIHGMLNHENFVAIMLPAGSMTPQEMQRSRALAENLKDRLNGNPHFAEWEASFAAAETAWATASGLCGQVDCPGPGSQLSGDSPTMTAGSSRFAEYYTVIDAIGYTDSGFNGDYFAQNTGLNAPGYDIELAYNHITVDSQYEAGAQFNDYHVKTVREITKTYMDAAALDVQISFETGGKRTLVLENNFVATNLDDEDPTPGADSWAVENPGDDLWEYSLDNPFFARPVKYWEDLRPFVRDGDQPGVLTIHRSDAVSRAMLDRYDTFVISGSAIDRIRDDQGAIDTIRAWVEDGGDLVLTDGGLEFLDLAGLTTDGVDVVSRYMGGIKIDLDNDGRADDHPMLAKLNDGVMQMYEPTPLGFGTTGSAPNWFLTDAAAESLGAEIVGRECGLTSLNTPTCDNHGVGLGRADVGEGSIQFMGSILPDPTEEFYHPYGLDNYATTYSGNQIVRNMLGWDEVFQAPPVVIQDGQVLESDNEPVSEDDDSTGEGPDGDSGGRGIPGVGAVALLVTLGALAVALRRRD